ncbi:aminoglycoside phosphotransferase family protein [Streptomyces uncialis]|uniref:aminoglycoside phosphotransferase family protein n=1 Tax=Streptomyces uncialis TaxID=1048205 RepID=UPI00381CD3C8
MTTEPVPERSLSVLAAACRAAGFDPAGAVPVRLAENEVWRLPGRVVVRIVRPGQEVSAAREIRVAHWLAGHGVPAVRPLAVPQPVDALGHPATFWEQLPPHTRGTTEDVVGLLKQLHALPVPDGIGLAPLDPFVRLPERIEAGGGLSADDREWLRGRLAELRERWAGLPPGLPHCVVHGDAWIGNVARTPRAVLLDFERVSVGPPEWDLVGTAAKIGTTGTVTAAEYEAFCEAYGVDVMAWDGYGVLAAVRELRMVGAAVGYAARWPSWRGHAQRRVDCLRGRVGPRPWNWPPIL